VISNRSFCIRVKGVSTLIALASLAIVANAGAADSLLARTNLVAWCIVPFDARQRGPDERAAMLERIGITQLAYDYRPEHIPTFDAELKALARHNIRLRAWWFPGVLNDEARLILEVLERHRVHEVQLWVTGGGEPTQSAEEQRARIEAEAARIQPIAEAAEKLGGAVALYNHGGWFGEPENQIAIIETLRGGGLTNVGIVYNQHHGHHHVHRFAELLAQMQPYLLAFNLNGMALHGDRLGKKILPLGQGELDLQLLTILRDSGWHGPVGILNHTNEDAEARLLDNLDGLDWLIRRASGPSPGSKPQPRTWKESP
jgi:sugar phosphate isomerase/epimerase